MDEGNEGDAIVLVSLRQIECNIPSTIVGIGQLSPDQLVDIVDRCLYLISGGSIKFQVPLPKNIATRHRICTDIANKIKSLGYINDCGYNQLLYPVEAQTRVLLAWLIQRLPKVEEDRQEVLGASALFIKRVGAALSVWREAQWLPHTSTRGQGPLARNVYFQRSISTLPQHWSSSSTDLFTRCSNSNPLTGSSLAHTLLERHALLLSKETATDSLLLDSLDSLNASFSEVVGAKTVIEKGREVPTSAANPRSSSDMGGVLDAVYGQTFSELIRSIKSNSFASSVSLPLTAPAASDPGATGDGGGVRSLGRFAQATVFSQETAVVAEKFASVVTLDSAGARGGADLMSVLVGGPAGSTAESEGPAIAIEEIALLESETEDLYRSLRAQEEQVVALQGKEEARAAVIAQLRVDVATANARIEQLESELLLRRQTIEMLPRAAEQSKALQTECQQLSASLSELGAQWEAARRPLLERVAVFERERTTRRDKCRAMVDDIKQYKKEMAGMVQELRDKQARAAALEEEKRKVDQSVSRAAYTQRIMDLTASIAKQNKEIEKVCADILATQRAVSQTTASLQRADALAEELIYKAANSQPPDKAMVAVYKQLSELRACFESLVGAVDRLSVSERLGHELETRIDQERGRAAAMNAEQVLADLSAVQAENIDLVAKIKSLRPSASNS